MGHPYRRFLLFCLLTLSISSLNGQNGGTLRGNLIDASNGAPIGFAAIQLLNTTKGTSTGLDGFFSISNIEAGEYTLVASYLGYEDTSLNVSIVDNSIAYLRILLQPSAINLETIEFSAENTRAKTQVRLSAINIAPQEIRALPSTGGEADIAQYLTVLPGIISTGDQGGQLYIRGGSPVQNKVLLDGMTIYNPFHSIGFFSVFETETIQNVEVLTGGFNAEHGGRISAVVDIKTREGNKKRWGGLVSASPFQAKAVLEGPIVPFNKENGTSVSLLLTGKHSYINETSKVLYDYAVDTTFFSFAQSDTAQLRPEDIGLPYNYTDLYGKLSLNAGNGSRLDIFGFNHRDEFNFVGLTALDWNAFGLGANFKVVPPNSDIIINGAISFSDYLINLEEADGRPRSSAISALNALLEFDYLTDKQEIHYGFEFTGFNTDFEFVNLFNQSFQQRDFTSELAGFFKYKGQFNRLIIEPGLRLHYYASQATLSVEPRLGLKYNVTDAIRVKLGAGRYAQNLISTRNDLDIVNFFSGYLAGPEETIFQPGTTTATNNRLQTALHAVAGIELDVRKNLQVNIEPYYKDFVQLISINRNKLQERDPNFMTETGEAYGIDLSAKYALPKWYFWATYSWAKVNRDDGEQVYPTVFDRRHNVNFLATYTFGANKNFEASFRWNYGSGFPFTQTQGFYQQNSFVDLLQTDVLTGNFPIGTLLSDDRNGGRLSDYHRLDLSFKYSLDIGAYSGLEVNASVTNAYNRENIFYVDRLTNNRVNQLPILPSLGLTLRF